MNVSHGIPDRDIAGRVHRSDDQYLAVYAAALAVLVGAITIGLLVWMEAVAP